MDVNILLKQLIEIAISKGGRSVNHAAAITYDTKIWHPKGVIS